MINLSTGSFQWAAVRENCWPVREPHRSKGCVRLEAPPERPDPAIYSQQEELSAGRPAQLEQPRRVHCELPVTLRLVVRIVHDSRISSEND